MNIVDAVLGMTNDARLPVGWVLATGRPVAAPSRMGHALLRWATGGHLIHTLGAGTEVPPHVYSYDVDGTQALPLLRELLASRLSFNGHPPLFTIDLWDAVGPATERWGSSIDIDRSVYLTRWMAELHRPIQEAKATVVAVASSKAGGKMWRATLSLVLEFRPHSQGAILRVTGRSARPGVLPVLVLG